MSDTENIAEKDKLNIYDNDEAYMLYDEKQLDYQDGEQLLEDEMDINLNSDNDNAMYDFEAEQGNLNQEEDELDGEENGSRRRTEIEIEQLNDDDELNENLETSKKHHQDMDRSKSYSNLITLKYISVCQSCKENFNSNTNLPYLLKCGHFFCRFCLEHKFNEEDGRIFCPDDGIVANSIDDLKVLNNLVIEKNVDDENDQSNRSSEFCKVHPTQKLSHYIEDTGEVICVYCAFTKFKKNPKFEIKEIKEKCGEVMKEVDKHLEDNQQYVETLRLTLNDIQNNKQTEMDRVSNFYEEVEKFLEEKKLQTFEKIENMFTMNTESFSKQLNYFSSRMEDAEMIKARLIEVMNDNSSKISQTLEAHVEYVKESNNSSKYNMELFDYKFSHDDESKLFKYLSNFGDLKTVKKNIRFTPKNTINYLQQKLTNINTSSAASTQNNEMNYDYQYKKIEKINLNSVGTGINSIINMNNMNNITTNSNLNANQKNYENLNNFPTPKGNYNKYANNVFQNDILNTSDLLSDNDFIERTGPGVNKGNKVNYSYTSKADLNGQNDSNLISASSKNYSNLNREHLGISSKYSYNHRNTPVKEAYKEQKAREYNSSNPYNKLIRNDNRF